MVIFHCYVSSPEGISISTWLASLTKVLANPEVGCLNLFCGIEWYNLRLKMAHMNIPEKNQRFCW